MKYAGEEFYKINYGTSSKLTKNFIIIYVDVYHENFSVFFCSAGGGWQCGVQTEASQSYCLSI